MAMRCCQSLLASLLLLLGCADNPPAVIENQSVAAVDVPPEVRRADSNFPDYGRNLAAGPDYVVEPGDTLYAVAFRLGVDYRTLASLNNIDPPYVIRVGQALKTAPPTGLVNAPAVPETTESQVSAQQRAGGAGVQSVVKSAAESTAGNAAESATEAERAAAAARQSESRQPSRTLSTAKTPAPNAPVDRWSWPAEGKVSRAYSAERHKGIDLVGERGSPVKATAAGVVV